MISIESPACNATSLLMMCMLTSKRTNLKHLLFVLYTTLCTIESKPSTFYTCMILNLCELWSFLHWSPKWKVPLELLLFFPWKQCFLLGFLADNVPMVCPRPGFGPPKHSDPSIPDWISAPNGDGRFGDVLVWLGEHWENIMTTIRRMRLAMRQWGWWQGTTTSTH